MSEIKITIIDREGVAHEFDAPTDMGLNMMEFSKACELPVEGTCGGMALCASCHMYIESDHDLPMPTADEEDMLDQAFFVESNSRPATSFPFQYPFYILRNSLWLWD